MKLLLVEDDPTLQDAMQRLLLQWGYGLEVAGTGGEAMGWLEQERFDLVLLDLGLARHRRPEALPAAAPAAVPSAAGADAHRP